ncbi:MAG: methionine--tRNA ligase [Myxococcota bacterium]
MSDRFYVTTPIYYVNAEPHIGHTYTTVLADTLTRFERMRGRETLLLTGSDEHGEKILEVAKARGEAVATVAAHYSDLFRETWSELGIGVDRFVRTTDPQHEAVVRDVLQRLFDAGQIDFREYSGLYCVGCERFLTDRDLEDGLCRDHERAPEERTEANYFFRMSDHFEWLKGYLTENPEFLQPERYRNEALAMLDAGLGDLCISRPKKRLDWGIELPFDADYVCYVWFDALLSYLSGIGYPDGPDFESWWAASTHLIAKDILKPHAIFWPAMLRAMGLAPPHRLAVHGYWNVDDRKVSKSLGNMVSPRAMEATYGFEVFRYYLLRDMVFGVDSNFTEERLIARVNADLANNLGNLVSRSLNMTGRYTDGRVPPPGALGPAESRVREAAEAAFPAVEKAMASLQTHRALEAIFKIVDTTNRYLEEKEPWRAAKDPDRAQDVQTTLYTCCEALRITALLLAPFLPEHSSEILCRIGYERRLEEARLPEDLAWGGLAVGAETVKGAPLFPRIETAES